MAEVSPTRPRRAATRRRVVVEESDDDDLAGSTQGVQQDEEDDFTPAPKRSPQRPNRRKTTGAPATPRTAARTRKTRTGESIEPSQIFEPDVTMSVEPESPTKKPSPRKRKSTAAPKIKSEPLSDAPSLPTPMPSATPRPLQSQGTPLADITKATINEQPTSQDSQKASFKAKPLNTVLEKPMEIVIRSRALPAAPPQGSGPPKSRTVIKYLVLTNFKSYAGRQEVGPFHASFSSVVGPNGSGKSNVIDSLLFVFGFRASKMRQGKISALIHNSAAFPNLEFCEVEVHFQEIKDVTDGKHEIVPDSTLIISRRAYKSNASKYYINTQESNFTAVTTLLKDRGVDLDHKRFLILQGEVESIAQMKPKAANEHDDGLLEYLEDIIGTSKYKSPIEESATEVETLNDICLEKSARVQHVEKEKNGLEDKKDKALVYIRDENDLAAKQSALYQVYINECNDNVQVTEEAIGQIQSQLNAELEKHQGNEDGIKEVEKQFKRETKNYESMEKATQGVLKEMAKFDQENVKFEEKKKFLAGKQKKLEKVLQSSRLSSSEADRTIGKHQDDIERNALAISDLEANLQKEQQELEVIRDNLKGKTQAFSDEIAKKQKSLEPWMEKISEKHSAISIAQSELSILQERASSGAVALEEAKTKLSSVEEGLQNKNQEFKELEGTKLQLEKDMKGVQVELSKIKSKDPEFKSKLSGARQRADEARSSLSSSQSQGNVLDGLNRLKSSGRIDGFHGRLGNLGTIDQKYDVAVSTACPSLENLVVDSVDVGQQCIDYLRKNNLGRANIILLDRLAKRDLSTLETPESVSRLFDLVKAKDEKFRLAFFSVLQNTLVAKDLEQANRIAYGARRWRVVTLDGQLIDVSGTMSGGGARVAKGGMSSKLVAETTKEQVSKLEVDRDALEQQFQIFQERQRKLESALKDMENQIPQLETKMERLNLEIESSKRNLSDAKRRISELSKQENTSKTDDAQTSRLEKQIVQFEKEEAKLHSQSAGLEKEIADLQAKIMEVGGAKLRGQKSKVDSLQEHIDLLSTEISNAEVAKAKAEKDKVKQEKAIAQTEKELASASSNNEELETQGHNQSSDKSKLKREAEEAKDALEIKKEELHALKQELDTKTAELNETRAVEIEMKNKLEEDQKVLNDNQKRLRYWTEKVSKLTIQSVSDLGKDQEADALPQYSKDELLDMNKDSLKAEIAILEERTQNVNVELGVLAEYRRRVEELASRSSDLNLAVTSRDTAKKRCDDLRKLRLEGFMEGFSMISLRLKEMYQMITMGGNAELELVDSLDPFSEGILFSVMPPKKSWKNISNLSGGEKTLSSLALVFALHHYKPTPLYVMDEIDAALDFRNVSRINSCPQRRNEKGKYADSDDRSPSLRAISRSERRMLNSS